MSPQYSTQHLDQGRIYWKILSFPQRDKTPNFGIAFTIPILSTKLSRELHNNNKLSKLLHFFPGSVVVFIFFART